MSGPAEAGASEQCSLTGAGWLERWRASNCAPQRANSPVDENERAPSLAASLLCENKYIQSLPRVWNNTPAVGFHWSFHPQLQGPKQNDIVLNGEKGETIVFFLSGDLTKVYNLCGKGYSYHNGYRNRKTGKDNTIPKLIIPSFSLLCYMECLYIHFR